MKVFYVMARIESSIGVLKKIRSQIDNLIDLGIDVTLVAGYGDAQSVVSKVKFDEIFYGLNVKFCKVEYKSIFNFINKFKYLKQFYRELEKISEGHNIDFYYYRGLTAEWNLLKFVKKHPKKVVFEINTIIRHEYKLRKAYGKLLLNYIFMKKILIKVAACVTVTDEIAGSLKRIARKDLITKTISNGVEVKKFPQHQRSYELRNTINLIFVGYTAIWHGLDRLFYGLANFNDKERVRVFIVGPENETLQHRKIVNDLGISKQVIFCGPLFGEKLTELYNNIDIAVSSFGLHRLGLNEGAVLKTREYLARGIPIILSYNDVDLSMEFQDYFIQFSADELSIDFQKIDDFYHSINLLDSASEKLREKSKNLIDTSVKMKKLNEFLYYLKNYKQT